MASAAAHLKLSRHGIYYARFVVPRSLRHRYPGLPKEWKASLFSSNRRVAATLARRVSLTWSYVQAVLEPTPMKDFPRTAGFTLIERPWGREVHTTPQDTPEQLAQLFAHLERTGTRVPRVLTDLLEKNVAPVSALLTYADAGASDGRLDTSRAAPASQVIVDPDQLPAPTKAIRPDPSAAAQRSDRWLSQVIGEYRDFKFRTKAWKTEQTWTNAVRPDLALFRDLISDRQRVPDGNAGAIWDVCMRELTEDRLQRAIKDLRKYPRRQGRRTGDDAKRTLAKGGNPVSEATFRKKLERIHAFMTWASRSKYCSADLVTDIALELEGSPSDNEDSGYRGFGPEELQRLFSSLAYQQDAFDEAWKHYAPLLALTTGTRVRELADLTVDDVVEQDGVPCLWIRGGKVTFDENGKTRTLAKRLKTPSALRKVPLSTVVLESGFLDYVQAQRARQKVWLWDNLRWEEKSGRGRKITEWFAEYLEGLGLKERDTVFHSFRTNFNRAISNTGLDAETIQALLGHAPKSERGRSYSRGKNHAREIPLRLVRDRLQLLDWGVDFLRSRRWV